MTASDVLTEYLEAKRLFLSATTLYNIYSADELLAIVSRFCAAREAIAAGGNTERVLTGRTS